METTIMDYIGFRAFGCGGFGFLGFGSLGV